MPLPPVKSIHELGDELQADEIPEAYYISKESEKGIGEIFVGRTRILQDIEAFLKQEKTNTSDFAMLLTNAPGAGKSTILDEFRLRQAEAGQPVLQVAPSAFFSEESLMKALQQTDLWKRSLGTEGRFNATTRDIGLMGGLTETFLNIKEWILPNAEETIGRFRRWYAIADALHEALRREPPKDLDDTLRAIDTACTQGWIIAVDECSEWDRHTDNAILRDLLYRVADPTKRRGAQVAHGGLLLTGLSEAQQAAITLTLSRAEIKQLPPLSPPEAAMLIRTTLERAGTPPAITERWTQTLARDFGMWTQHAQRAASVAAEMIKRTYRLGLSSKVREKTWDHRLELVRQQAAAQIVDVYGYITGRAVDLIGEGAMIQLATLNQQTNGQIPNQECLEIINTGHASGNRAQPERAGPDAVARELMAVGLLHKDMKITPSHSQITWSIPMGSLTGHILGSLRSTNPSNGQTKSAYESGQTLPHASTLEQKTSTPAPPAVTTDPACTPPADEVPPAE